MTVAAMQRAPSEDQLYDLAEVFKVFGDSTRIRILYRLFSGEYGVNELAESLNLTQSAVSHQTLKASETCQGTPRGKIDDICAGG